MRSWYSINAKAKPEAGDAPTEAEVFVFDAIGKAWSEDEAVSARQFIADLQALPETVKTLRVRVSSPGGDPFEALVIANALKSERDRGRTVEVSIEGLAASAATVVTSAGNPVRIASNGLLMVHNPFTIALGDADEMRKTAEALDKARDSMVSVYQWLSPLSAEKLRSLMAEETWMDADEAVANGFATEIVEGLAAAASITPSAVEKLEIPEKFAPRIAALLRKPGEPPTPAPAPPPAPPAPAGPPAATAAEVLEVCAKAELLDLAPALARAGKPLADVEAAVQAEAAARKAEADRTREIRQLCAAAFSDRQTGEAIAAAMVEGGMASRQARTLLTTVTALADSTEIDGALLPEGSGAPPRGPRLSTAEIYRERNKTHDAQRGLTTG